MALALLLCHGQFALEPARVAKIAETAAGTRADHALDQQKEMAIPNKSIAVLPFTNMSPELEDEYFSDGLTEELIGVLAKVDGLQVTARTSAFAFKGVNQDIRELGKRLNVRTVLEGSVRREQNRVRDDALLINVEDGYHLWSDSYDYELTSVLALQETISRAIVSALQIELSSRADEQINTNVAVNPEAYDLYLKGRYYWARLSTGGFQKSIEAFRMRSPSIPTTHHRTPVWRMLTVLQAILGSCHHGRPSPCPSWKTPPLALDPASSEALVARGMACLIYEWDWDCARDNLELALELSPNFSMAHWAYTEYLMIMDPSAALSSALRALALDPLSLPIMNLVAFTYLEQQMYAERYGWMKK